MNNNEQIIQISRNNRITFLSTLTSQIFLFFFLIIFIFGLNLYYITSRNNLNKNFSFHQISDLFSIQSLRNLEEEELEEEEKNETQYFENKTENELYEMIVDRYNTEFPFFQNISYFDYYGEWGNFSFENNIFNNKKGEVELYFYKKKTGRVVYLDLFGNKSDSFKGVFLLKDGKYIDKYIKANFTLYLPKNFIEKYDELKDKDSFKLDNNNTNLDFVCSVLLYNYTSYTFNETNITIRFFNKPKRDEFTFEKSFETKFSSILFSIRHENFTFDIKANTIFTKKTEEKIRNYSFILTLIGCYEIYGIFILIIAVSDNNQIGLNLDLTTIIISIFYKSFICSIHFYLSISTSSDDLSYSYGIPAIIYFFAFSGFELRLLLFSWRSRNMDLLFSNPTLFRRKMFYFYLFFYILLFACLLNIRSILTNFLGNLILFSCSWIFQIIYSIKTGTRPPMSRSYIFFSSIGRLFPAIYLKAYPYNAFELKPSYLKTFTICLIVLIETFIVLLQKTFGPKVIIPKKWKTLPYNYYRDNVDVNSHISQNPNCVICLEDLSKDIDDNFNEVDVKKKNKIEKMKKIPVFGFCITKIENWALSMVGKVEKKKYMITPCDHVFHTVCLEKWLHLKNECPYCKQKIPPLE